MNNSQSIERFESYFRAINGCELSTGRRKAAQLADGLVSPNTIFYKDIREIFPEFAGYGVLPRSQLREVMQASAGLTKDDFSRPPRWSASNQAWQLMPADRKHFDPPAKDSTCEKGSGQGRVGSKASGACRVP